MDELSREELQKKHQSAQIMMILGVVFLSVSNFSAFIFGIVGGFLGFYSFPMDGMSASALVTILFAVFGYLIIGGTYAAGVPLLVIGIVNKIKSKNRLKALDAADSSATDKTAFTEPDVVTDLPAEEAKEEHSEE